jgi:hypothetical protein
MLHNLSTELGQQIKKPQQLLRLLLLTGYSLALVKEKH